nr:hypothetical protein [Tanacetum cinerariifolium]
MRQIDTDNIGMQAMCVLVVLFDKASTTKDYMIKAYKECKDISQKRRTLIVTFLKDESLKDYDIHNDLFELSPSEYPKEKHSIHTPAKLAHAKLNKRSGDADLSKDMSGPELPPELQRSWCDE